MNNQSKVKSRFDEFESSKQLGKMLNNICKLSHNIGYYDDLVSAIIADKNYLNYSHSDIETLHTKFLNAHKEYYIATLEYFDFALKFYQNYSHYNDNDWRKIKIDYHKKQKIDIEKAFEKEELNMIINKIDNIIDFLSNGKGYNLSTDKNKENFQFDEQILKYINVIDVSPGHIEREPYNEYDFNVMDKLERLNKDIQRIRVTKEMYFEHFMPKKIN